MTENYSPSPISGEPSLWRSLLVLFGFVLVGMSLGNLVMAMIIMSFFAVSGQDSGQAVQSFLENSGNTSSGWYALMLMQGLVHITTFLIPSLVYARYIDRRVPGTFFQRSGLTVQAIALVLVITVVVIPVISMTVTWNEHLVFPDFLKGVEDWMRAKEDNLALLTEKYMNFSSWSQLFIAVLVVAVVPAIGEEALFRGILQKKLISSLNNPHLGIWLAAAIFSAIHFQFYGFLPRMLLGALFGYIYLWTGRLSLAIFSHFINNGLMVVMVYLYRQKLVSINLESNDSVPVSLALASLLLSALLLNVLYKEYKKGAEGIIGKWSGER